ncbi:phage capsid scaffolding protein (GPO) serine peptidase [Rhodobiaceae bacterium]|nr:phage capsid scaffolding protein (GPO) serine peptidase [Rhodobiaceae bacterium]
MKKLISNFVRIATEGLTIDGRTITADQLSQMAASYDPEKYGARIWLEHFRSLFADGAFPALGDVVDLKTEKDSDGKLALYGRLQPNDKLMEMNKQGQKVYTSIEMDGDFAGSGQAYLVGLAVTDSPASLGTERLQFAQDGINRFADGDKKPKTQIWPAVDAGILEFSEEGDGDKPDQAPGLFSKVTDILNGTSKRNDQRFADMEISIVELAKGVDGLNQKLADLTTSGNDTPAPDAGLAKQVETMSAQLSTLTEKITGEPDPATPARPESQGFTGTKELADC